MLLKIITNIISDETKFNITDRLMGKHGTDEWMSIVYSGADKAFSKCQREYCKAFAGEMVSKLFRKH